MVLVGPQHGKSTIVSQLFPAIALAHNPATKLILLSYSADLAATHSLAARDRVTEWQHSLSPEGSLKLKMDAQARNSWYTTAGGYLKSASIQGTVTGLAADGILIDDPFKGPEDSASPVIRDKVWAVYSSVAETRLAPDGFVVLIGTPWHTDDLRGRLLNTEPDEWLVLRFPALAEHDDPLGRELGDGLFLERYPQEWYEATRAKLEARGLSHLWSALYQCSPTGDPTLRAFHDDTWFAEHIWVDDLPISETNPQRYRVLALDPCKSKTGKVGDYAAFADLTLMRDNNVYADMHLSRPTLPKLYETAMALVRKAIDEGRPYHAMTVECNLFQQAVATAIQERLERAMINLYVHEHNTTSTDEKNARIITSLSPLLSRRRLKFVGKTLSNTLTVRQTQEIPNGAHDDGPDAIELGLRLLNALLGGSVKTSGRVLTT